MSRFSSHILAGIFTVATVFVLGHSGNAFGKDDQVFMDEGDGDFGELPVPKVDEHATEKKAAAQKPVDDVVESVQGVHEKEVPEVTDDASDGVAMTAKELAPVAKSASHVAKTKAKEQKTRHVASVKSGGFFMYTTKACPMLRAPASSEAPVSFTRFPRKIWVEKYDGHWAMAFTKDRTPAFVAADCVKH